MELESLPGARKSFIFTNKLGDYIFLPISRENFSKYNGFHFKDFWTESIEILKEGERLNPSSVHITPEHCEFTYPGMREKIIPTEGSRKVCIEYASDFPMEIRPFFAGPKLRIDTKMQFHPDEARTQKEYEYDRERGDSCSQEVYSDGFYRCEGSGSLEFVFDDFRKKFSRPRMPGKDTLDWSILTGYRMITEFEYGTGIIAGIPWFNIPWVRDELISFKGLVLIPNLFKEGKKILETIFRYVSKGRVPNFFDGKAVTYNSIDSVPLFINALCDYMQESGDRGLVEEHTGQIEGIFEYAFSRSDERGFLTAGPKETWMDTLDRSGACVEIQALWYEMLGNGADILGGNLGERCRETRGNVRDNFENVFWNGRYLKDRDGDDSFRPNQLFAVLTDLVSTDKRIQVMDLVRERLWAPHGIMSLEKGPGFIEHDTGVNPESYHNGDVWSWLTGLAAQCEARLGRKEKAHEYLQPLIKDVLEEGALGSICEIKSASSPEPRGCFSQAWSLGKFIEAAYECSRG